MAVKRVRELQARVGWCQLSDAIPGRLPVVADAEAELGRVDVLKAFDVASASFGEALHGLPDAAGDALNETGHVRQVRPGPFDLYYSGLFTLIRLAMSKIPGSLDADFAAERNER